VLTRGALRNKLNPPTKKKKEERPKNLELLPIVKELAVNQW